MTAVEWLVNEFSKDGLVTDLWEKEIEKALEMEKQQIIDAYNSGQQIPPFDFAEQYYNEKFNK